MGFLEIRLNSMFSKGLGKNRTFFFFRSYIRAFSGFLQLLWSEQDVHCNSHMPPAIHFSSLVAEYGYGIEGGRKRCFLLCYSFSESLGHNKKLLAEQQPIRSVLHCSRSEGNGPLSTNQKRSPNKGWSFPRTGTSLLKA